LTAQLTAMPENDQELLGTVRCPSGIAVVLDAGMLGLWCHRDFDDDSSWPMDDELRRTARESADLRIEGPDAEAAAEAFDRQWHRRYLFDIPIKGLAKLTASFDELVGQRHLRAKLTRCDRRIPHRERIDLAIAQGNGFGEMQYHGMWAAVVAGLPPDRSLPVYGERIAAGPDARRWRRVYVELVPHARPRRSEHVGYAMVDEARLLVADADALGRWAHGQSLDGLVDVAFWGADESQIASMMGAGRLQPHQRQRPDQAPLGWTDMQAAEAEERYQAVRKCRNDHGLKVTIDYRPHSHLHQLMSQVDRTPTEAGTVKIGHAELCGFMTSWGDGIFDVLHEHDDEGRLVRITMDVGNDTIVQRQRRLEEWWFGLFSKMAIVSKQVAEKSRPVGYLYREQPSREQDSGWRITAGDESQDYMDDAENHTLMPLRDLIGRDAGLEEIFRQPIQAAFQRDEDGRFVAVPFEPSLD
jgi:hypothetical protein